MERTNSRVNINLASIEELESLKGIGPALARAIASHRETLGPFHSVDELIKVKGIGPALVNRLRDQLTVEEEGNLPHVAIETAANTSRNNQTERPAAPELLSDVIETEVMGQETLPPEQELSPEEMNQRQRQVEQEVLLEMAEREEEHEAAGSTVSERVEEPTSTRPHPEETVVPPSAPQATPRRPVEEEYPLPPPLEIVEPKAGRLTVWKALIMVFLGGILGGVLTIGLLFLLNGTLFFSSRTSQFQLQGDVAQLRADRASLVRQIEGLETQIVAFREELTVLPQMRSDIATLSESVSRINGTLSDLGRDLDVLEVKVTSLGEDVQTLAGNMEKMSERVEDLSTTLDKVTGQVQALEEEFQGISKKAERFDAFLAGLLALVQQTAPTTQ